MFRIKFLTAFLLVLLLAGSGTNALAGTVTGIVKFEGEAPEMKPLKVPEEDACIAKHGGAIMNEALVLGEGQTMANVIIHIVSGLPDQEWEMPKESAELDQQGCHYKPHVLAVRAGQNILVKNPDEIFHNVHAHSDVNPPMNLAMPANKNRMIHKFDKAETPFKITCDVHPWMASYCGVFDHPFFFVTDNDGKFTLKDVPAGTYEIEAWHERLPAQKATVTVDESGEQSIDFTFKKR